MKRLLITLILLVLGALLGLSYRVWERYYRREWQRRGWIP